MGVAQIPSAYHLVSLLILLFPEAEHSDSHSGETLPESHGISTDFRKNFIPRTIRHQFFQTVKTGNPFPFEIRLNRIQSQVQDREDFMIITSSNNCYDCRSFLFRLQFFLKLFLFCGVERREFFHGNGGNSRIAASPKTQKNMKMHVHF